MTCASRSRSVVAAIGRLCFHHVAFSRAALKGPLASRAIGNSRLEAVLLKDPWALAKRAAGSLTLTLPAFGTGEAWAVVAVVAILVLAVLWLSRKPDTDVVETPILTWRRRPGRVARSRRDHTGTKENRRPLAAPAVSARTAVRCGMRLAMG